MLIVYVCCCYCCCCSTGDYMLSPRLTIALLEQAKGIPIIFAIAMSTGYIMLQEITDARTSIDWTNVFKKPLTANPLSIEEEHKRCVAIQRSNKYGQSNGHSPSHEDVHGDVHGVPNDSVVNNEIKTSIITDNHQHSNIDEDGEDDEDDEVEEVEEEDDIDDNDCEVIDETRDQASEDSVSAASTAAFTHTHTTNILPTNQQASISLSMTQLPDTVEKDLQVVFNNDDDGGDKGDYSIVDECISRKRAKIE